MIGSNLGAFFTPLGALAGMYAFHYKTKHPKFYITLPVLLGVHLLLLAWWYLR